MTKVTYSNGAKNEWDKRTSTIKPSKVEDNVFSKIFKIHIPKNTNGECLEIGSIPGEFLVYFHNEFGYRPNGIDFSDNTHIFHQTMKKNGITDYTFQKGDFFKYNFTKQYDLVTSFGFIEHFDDVADVLRRHAALVKPGGTLVITLPNFRFLQHIYHYYFDKENLDIHNLRAMRLGYLKRQLHSLGLQKKFAGYYGNLSVWRQDTELDLKSLRRVNAIHRWVAQHGHKMPTTRAYSPYIVLIYRKPESHESVA